MIIVEPPATRFEVGETGDSNEEHLLERISSLENRQTRLTEKLERALDLLLRQAQNSHFDRALVRTLSDLLTDDGIIQNEKLERLWLDRCQKDAEEQQESERRELLRLRILANYSGGQRAAFEQQVNEGFLLIDDEQVSRGIRVLQRAADSSVANAPLLGFLGEHFFKRAKTVKAQDYLSRAFDVAPDDQRVQLLLGLTCADEGDTERAKELLLSAARIAGSTFAAHFGLGRLFAAERQWNDAVREFKLALASKESPEAHYALGCLYFQLSRDSLAAKHLRKAVQIDTAYSEAFHLLGLVCERAGQNTRAMQYFEKAGTGRFLSGGVSAKVRRDPNRARTAGPAFRMLPARSRRLITVGDRRVAEALRQDALTVTGSDLGADSGRR